MAWQIRSAEFVKSGTKPAHFPPPDRPEIAFGGRSNVGKSSLINALLERKSLVRTSKTPGRTQLINFFNVNDALYIVDLPGYGFARVPDSVKRAWGPMIEGYLAQRPNLHAIVVVMDLRRGVKEDDMHLIKAAPLFGIQPILVFTKADKYGPNARKARRFEIARQLEAPPQELILFSSTKGFGQEELWKRIRGLTGL